MRLTEPGVYVARDRRVAMSIETFTGETRYVIRTPGQTGFYLSTDDTEGDWQRIDLSAIKWPELPKKPWQVYGKGMYHGPDWWIIRGNVAIALHPSNDSMCCMAWIKDFTVVPHYENDPEAVAMIEAAKEAT